MNKNWLGLIKARLFAVVAILSLVAIPLIPTTALAADSLSRDCTERVPGHANVFQIHPAHKRRIIRHIQFQYFSFKMKIPANGMCASFHLC